MTTKILLNSMFDQMLDFFYSFISEEDCRICSRVMLARGQLLQDLQDFSGEARPAMIHRWLNDIPRYSRVICSDCWQGLSSETPLLGFYEHDGERSFAIVSGAPYIGEIRSLIHRLKYGGDRLLAADLATIMLSGWRIGSIFLDHKNAVLVPVPLHWRKGMERGFNQAELLANEASKVLSIPVLRGALKRRRATTPQQSLEKAERFRNLENAFQGNPSKLMGRTVVLVDDVCTSGATLAECVREVNRCGATKVVALTVARTMLRIGRINGNDRSKGTETMG
ncbi:MAG: ComF family protein [Candidatus Melainabacteria bacterium]|nr:ComF family protein [Candidatus Melainabacteria bacterium]